MDSLWSVLHDFLNKITVFGPEIEARARDAITMANLAGQVLTTAVLSRWIKNRRVLILSKDASFFTEQHGGPLADLLNAMNNLWNTIGDVNKAVIWDYLAYFVELSDSNTM